MRNSDELDDILDELKNKQTHHETETFNLNDVTNSEKISEDNIFPKTEKNFELEINSTNTNKADSNFFIEETTDFKSEQDNDADEYQEENMASSKKPPKKIIISIIAVILVIALGAGIYFGMFYNKADNNEPETKPTEEITEPEPIIITNPFTGEADYNENAVGKRPVAIVVENASAARPQWGINTPDMILEGEVEGGESRMLWFYADYTSVPEKVGPIRSARPPYIKFSELFDSVFIHWGQSKSKGNYVGAKEVFKQDNVDHINQMAYKGNVKLFGRDKSRKVSTEHTGVLYGKELKTALKEYEFRTDLKENKFSTFSFNEKPKTVGETPCSSIGVKFSSRTSTRDWKYDTQDKMYHTNDFKTDVARKNILVLNDSTEYVSKANYKGGGSSEVYCNYKLSGGDGVLASEGTCTEITWSVSNGKLILKDANTSQELTLNVGNTWIGYASSNNGGKTNITE